jgi:hypothetical protein
MSELKKFYKTRLWAYNDNLEVKNAKVANDRDSILLTESVEVNIENYASINGSDYLLLVNPFDRNTYVPKRYRNRKLPLEIPRGYKDVNEYTYKIPAGYEINMLPPAKIIENKFGKYEVNFIKLDNQTFIYQKSLLIRKGEYPKEEYKAYRKFRKSIAKYENLRIALTKKT